jgi:hypothetical protein
MKLYVGHEFNVHTYTLIILALYLYPSIVRDFERVVPN